MSSKSQRRLRSSVASCVDGSIFLRTANALPCSPLSPGDLSFDPSHRLPFVAGRSGSTVSCDPSSVPLGLYAGDELGDHTVSLPETDHQMRTVSADKNVFLDEEYGKLSDEDVGSFSSFESEAARSPFSVESGESWLLSSLQNLPNSDPENAYESISKESILTYSQKDLISRLMDEICSSLFFQVCCRPRQHGPRAADSFSSDSAQTSINATDNSSDGSPISRQKRAREGDEYPEDDEGGRDKRRRAKNSTLSEGTLAEVRHFACPFHKFDVSTYSNRNGYPRFALKFRSCGPPGWPTIGKMK